MEINVALFEKAYKKLKSSIYFDKTQNVTRNKLVEFECSEIGIEETLNDLALAFSDKEERDILFDEIIQSISFNSFPKKFSEEKTGKNQIIKNFDSESLVIEENQYFINMDIRGHILGVVWLLTIGYKIDGNEYEHSYGNRIRKKLYNEFSKNPTYSPYLFEPYFQQYESWRDNAMDTAQRHLKNGDDVVIMTMDFKRFFYSLDITQKFMNGLYKEFKESGGKGSVKLKALNNFVFRVIEKYASLHKEFEERKILPIGFLPSNVLANYALRNFDKAIADGWNPIYYGRYVDDVILVEKVEKNSDIASKSKLNELDFSEIVGYYLKQCSHWNGITENLCCQKKSIEKKELGLFKQHKTEYIVNKKFNPTLEDKSKIMVNDDKLKIFYFQNGQSEALIECFRETISKNKSEFRHMPEDDNFLKKEDYSKIYDLSNEGTINKFNGIQNITIDRFELSKLLGKYSRIGSLVNDSREHSFEKNIDKVFSSRVIIENYTSWEKVLEILTLNESWNALEKMIDKILKAIDKLTYKDEYILYSMKESLYSYLNSSFHRASCIVWGDEVKTRFEEISRLIQKNNNFYRNEHLRKKYVKTRMINKSIIPVFIGMIDSDKLFKSYETINISNFAQVTDICKEKWDRDYKFYPYIVSMDELCISNAIHEMKFVHEEPFSDYQKIYKAQKEDYVRLNFDYSSSIINDYNKSATSVDKIKIGTDSNKYLLSVNNGKKDNMRIAVANIRLNYSNFDKVMQENPNRSLERFVEMSKLVNMAIDERTDMLIMPESYMPLEWLPIVARNCAKNNFALITGIEHVKIGKKIFNLTAVVLPYEDEYSKNAVISFHLKTHYAPAENKAILSYGIKPVEGNHYELYKWRDCYFPVYCCYELTSINERATFQSYADFLVAIEWNKDTNYYSNIVESLSRDIHCYCVQVNSSDYGDSRITKPSKTDEKDMLRTKGGKNSTVLVEDLDISKLREFQLKGDGAYSSSGEFKAIPLGFNRDIVLKKIAGKSLID